MANQCTKFEISSFSRSRDILGGLQIKMGHYSVFTHKLECVRRLWFKICCQRWRTSQGHRQSRTLEKWWYLGVRNGAR